jgi:peptidoglycan hydrolase FlgJ
MMQPQNISLRDCPRMGTVPNSGHCSMGTVPVRGQSLETDPELSKAAIAFEAVMLRQLIGSMRSASLGEDVFGSSASGLYRELADARTADALAARGAIGIAAMIERQLAKEQP